MTSQQARAALEEFEARCGAVCNVATVAKRNCKSLSGHGFYGKRFSNAVIALSRAEMKLSSVVIAVGLDGGESGRLSGLLDTLKSPKASPRQRSDALRAVVTICQTTILPAIERMTANPVPETEQVLPLDLVRPTRRKYIERVVLQANGCYEHGWYDACSVMIRRLVETLIIELYEAKGMASEIMNAAGGYHMLGDLVNAVISDKAWNLSRVAKKALPDIKSIGDQSAHGRRFVATKQDVDKIVPGLRVVVEELLHIAGLL